MPAGGERDCVVVTGAARGIGRTICERLLSDGRAVAAAAAARAAGLGRPVGWVNNAAVFTDASLHVDGSRSVLGRAAPQPRRVRRRLRGRRTSVPEAGGAGSVVNVSSHQAARPVPGSLPYATAKARSRA